MLPFSETSWATSSPHDGDARRLAKQTFTLAEFIDKRFAGLGTAPTASIPWRCMAIVIKRP